MRNATTAASIMLALSATMASCGPKDEDVPDPRVAVADSILRSGVSPETLPDSTVTLVATTGTASVAPEVMQKFRDDYSRRRREADAGQRVERLFAEAAQTQVNVYSGIERSTVMCTPKRDSVELLVREHSDWEDQAIVSIACGATGGLDQPAQITAALGKPQSVLKQATDQGEGEIWVYGRRRFLFIAGKRVHDVQCLEGARTEPMSNMDRWTRTVCGARP